MSDPLLFFRAAADALHRGDWPALADLCDAASLVSFKRQQVETFELAESQPELTFEQYVRHDPDIPREVAEYQFAQFNKHRDPASRLQRELPGVGSAQALREMSPADVFVAWLQGRSPRHQAQSLIREGHVPNAVIDEVLKVAEHQLRLVALGAVPDGDRVVHVLFRHEADMPLPDAEDEDADWLRNLSPEERELARDLAGRAHPEVATCRRQPNGEWRLLAGHDFLGLGRFVVSIGYDESGEQRADVS